MKVGRNCETHPAILALLSHGVLFILWLVLSRNGVSFSTIGTRRNLDWWNLVRGLIGLKDRPKRSLYWLVSVSPLYKHLGNLYKGRAARACPCCSAENEDDVHCLRPAHNTKHCLQSFNAVSSGASFPACHFTSLQSCFSLNSCS